MMEEMKQKLQKLGFEILEHSRNGNEKLVFRMSPDNPNFNYSILEIPHLVGELERRMNANKKQKTLLDQKSVPVDGYVRITLEAIPKKSKWQNITGWLHAKG